MQKLFGNKDAELILLISSCIVKTISELTEMYSDNIKRAYSAANKESFKEFSKKELMRLAVELQKTDMAYILTVSNFIKGIVVMEDDYLQVIERMISGLMKVNNLDGEFVYIPKDGKQ